MALPVWALKGRDLTKWSKLHGLTLWHSQTAQVLFLDNGEPIAMMFLRPLVLTKDGRAIMGTFKQGEGKKSLWVAGQYSGSVCGFVVHATDEMMRYIFDHPGEVSYFDVDARERVKKLLAQKGSGSWQTLKSLHSLQEESGWQSISQVNLDDLPAQPLASSPQPASKPVKQFQLTPTESSLLSVLV